MTVAARFVLVLVVPIAGLLGLTGFSATVYAQQVGRAGDLRGALSAAATTDDVVDGLQRERLAVARLLSGAGDEARAEFAAEAARTDAAIARTDPRVPGSAPGTGRLVALRNLAAGAHPDMPARVLLLQYRQLVADLVAYREQVAELPAPEPVATAARAAAWLATAKEELALTQVGVAQALAGGGATPADREAIVTHRAAAADALRRFTVLARPRWRALLVTPDLSQVDRVLLTPDGTGTGADTAAWGAQALAQLDALRAVTAEVGAGTVAAATDARDRQNRTLIAGLAIALVIAAASVGAAVAAYRSIVRPLRHLLAGEPLPQPSGRVRGDEVGQVVELVHALRREVPRIAAEQAALRTGAATMLAGAARRSARLADALLERLDEVEREELDPDRLAQLFAVDHLATRIRHDNHTLLVLAGHDAGRALPGPVPLPDVLRAAQSRIHAYERVEYGRLDAGVAVDAGAVEDVVHVLAELFDNAATFSAPSEPVVVAARRSGDGAVVQITDRGLGLDPARLAEANDRLADPPPHTTALGFAVVSRLAARHGLLVTVEQSPGEGLTAVVRLPATLICPAEAVLSAPDPAVQLAPRPLERSPALPGAEPVDVPAPRRSGGLMPVVPGGPTDGPTVEARAFGEGLPQRTVDTRDEQPQPEEVRALLTSYQHAISRFGSSPVQASAVPAHQEGHS